MTEVDLKWVQRMLDEKYLDGPILEMGTGYGGFTCKEIIESAGIAHFGTDLEKTPTVDFVANFENKEEMQVFSPVNPFGTVLIMNVLEHTFDPITILDNAMTLVKAGGKCLVLTPTVWPLHNFPMDAWRILPNFYEEYAQRRGYILDSRFFEYVGHGPVKDFRDKAGNYAFPPPSLNRKHLLWSKIVHKVLNTSGRGMFHPSCFAVGAVLQVPPA
jgi:SAM-dependent methyltransferase